MAKHASRYADEDDNPTAALLACLRAYGADTSEARLQQAGTTVEGTVPLPGRGGRLPVKLRRFAHELGWATTRGDGVLHVQRGPDVDVARDSRISLTSRTSSNYQRENTRWASEADLLQAGAKTSVNGTPGTLTEASSLQPGDTVHIEYADTRNGGGYAYSTTSQRLRTTVLHAAEDQVVLDDGRLDRTNTYEGSAVYERENGDVQALKHLVRLD